MGGKLSLVTSARYAALASTLAFGASGITGFTALATQEHRASTVIASPSRRLLLSAALWRTSLPQQRVADIITPPPAAPPDAAPPAAGIVSAVRFTLHVHKPKPRPKPKTVPQPSAPPVVVAAVTAAPPPPAGDYGCNALEKLWVSAGGSPGVEVNMASIAIAESSGRPSATNPSSGAAGLWQILGQVVNGNVYNPFTNALNAVKKYKDALSAFGNGYAPWTTWPAAAGRC